MSSKLFFPYIVFMSRSGAFACDGYLNVFTVVASRRKLYSPESDRTFERDLDGRLLHAVLSVERGVA